MANGVGGIGMLLVGGGAIAALVAVAMRRDQDEGDGPGPGPGPGPGLEPRMEGANAPSMAVSKVS